MELADLHALTALLDRQVVVGNALLAALEAERGALAGFEVATLEAATAEKERLAGDFDRLDGDRRRLLARLGFGPAREDMLALIRAAEDPNYRDDARRAGPIATRWRRLVSLAERCRDANQRNGIIVSMQSRRVTKALNVLRTGRPDELTYGRGPAAGYGATGRALGRV
jgi:flagellar biosynthesis/type III secretory pathway chaperone